MRMGVVLTQLVSFKNLSDIPYPSAYNSSASDGSSIYLSKGVRINSDNIIERAPEILRYDIIMIPGIHF